MLYAGFIDVINKRGPGIVRCNASLMDNEIVAKELSERVKQIIHDAEETFVSQHTRWDYCKMQIREQYIKQGRVYSRINKTRLSSILLSLSSNLGRLLRKCSLSVLVSTGMSV